MVTIYLVRHGQASFGQHDYDCLSTLGEKQALITGEWLAKTLGSQMSLAGCGTLLRQQQTLAGIHKGMDSNQLCPHLPADLVVPGLNELDAGDLMVVANPEYGDRAQLDAAISIMANPKQAFFNAYRSALTRWISGKYDSEYQESWLSFKTRTLDAIQQTVRQLSLDDSAVLVSSGGVISSIVLQLLNCPDDEMFRINRQIHNAAITSIAARNGKLSLHGFNNYAHLEVKGDKDLMTRI